MGGEIVEAPFPRWRLFMVVMENGFRLIVHDALRNWIRNLALLAPALGSMTLLLFLAGVVAILGAAGHTLVQSESKEASLLHIYIRDGASSSVIVALRSKLDGDPRVASVVFVSREEALARAKKRPGLPDLADAAGKNPFPASLDVQLVRISDVDSLDVLVRGDPAVDPVFPTSYDRGAYGRVQQVLKAIATVGIAFLVLLGVVAIAVTANGIRGAILSRRDEVRVMQLVGTRSWMIRGPFVVEGALTGAAAGIAAGLLLVGLTVLVFDAAAGSFTQFLPGVTQLSAYSTAGLLLAVGILLGCLSSVLGLRRLPA